LKLLDDDYYEDQNFRGLEMDGGEVHGITFVNCTFLSCAFAEATFKACRFQGCTFKKCDLSLVKLDDSSFSGSTFEDSRLIGVNWVHLDWGKSDFQPLSNPMCFNGCVLNYGTFMGLTLEKVVILRCTVWDVDFSDASLCKADCRFSDFTNSRFRHTDLSEADLRGASNYFIQPQHNTLKKTRFSLPEAMSLLYNLDIEISDPTEDESE